MQNALPAFTRWICLSDGTVPDYPLEAKQREKREANTARARLGSALGKRRRYKALHRPDFQNNIILTQTERLTMNSRPKQPKYARIRTSS